jgi:hypothetical protein
MFMPLSEYVSKAIAKMFDGAYVGLTTDKGEVRGGDYTRQPLALGFDYGDGLEGTSTARVTFPLATSPWGKVTGLAIFDQRSGGNELRTIQIAKSKQIDDGEQPSFAAGEISFSIRQAKS